MQCTGGVRRMWLCDAACHTFLPNQQQHSWICWTVKGSWLTVQVSSFHSLKGSGQMVTELNLPSKNYKQLHRWFHKLADPYLKRMLFQETFSLVQCMLCSSSIARSLVLAGHLLYSSRSHEASLEIAWHEWDEHGALAGHVPGQARPWLHHCCVLCDYILCIKLTASSSHNFMLQVFSKGTQRRILIR